jgi:hypothetical protein
MATSDLARWLDLDCRWHIEHHDSVRSRLNNIVPVFIRAIQPSERQALVRSERVRALPFGQQNKWNNAI